MRITSESTKSVEGNSPNFASESDKCKALAIPSRREIKVTESNQPEKISPEDEAEFWEEQLKHYGISIGRS
jgi:hypothetical protein